MSPGRLAAIAHKEVLHIRRDPLVLALALVVPVVLIVLFGFAVTFDLDRLPVALVDQDRTQESEAFLRTVIASGELVAPEGRAELAEAERALRRGDVVGVLVVPRGFAAAEGTRDVQLLVDGSDGTVANNVIGKADAIVGRLLPRSRRAPARFALLSAFNPASISAWFIVPGLAAYVVAIIAVLLTALTIAREFERGSMEQLFATPVTRLEIILGKLVPYLALGALAVALVLGVGALVFAVPMRGDPGALALASALFLVGMLAQGLLVSTLAPSQMVATQVATVTSVLPSMLLSGFVFPIENMPALLRAITWAVPARYYIEALRGVLLRGNVLAELVPECTALALYAALVLVLATRRFRKELA